MGGGPTFGKNSQIMSFFFLRAYLKSNYNGFLNQIYILGGSLGGALVLIGLMILVLVIQITRLQYGGKVECC